MKKLSTLLVVLSMLLALSRFTFAQQDESMYYAEVNYMKTKPGQNAINLEDEVWSPIHKEIIKEGMQAAWSVYTIPYPARMNSPYDYITVNYYTSMEQMERDEALFIKAMEAAHPGKKLEEIQQMTEDARVMVHRELYSRRDYTASENAGGTDKFIKIDFMKTSHWSMNEEYVDMESSMAKPVMNEFINETDMTFWGVWQKMAPAGANQESNFVTSQEWGTMEGMFSMNWEEAFESAQPNKKIGEEFGKIEKLRTLVQSEIWYRVISVNADSE
jgi:hypothetical protein